MEREIELSGEETSEMEPIAMNSSEAVPRTEFITGEAGTGKTWFVRERAKRLQGHVLCATTGIAAVNLGEGVTTLNSLLGYFDTASLRDAWTQGWLETKLMKLYGSGVRQLVVDEVSMMDGEQLTMIVQALDSCNERLEAQGEDGLGLTLTGDFLQLPPVKAKFAFQADCWGRFAENTTKLTEVRRQADGEFIAALQAARVGNGKKAVEYFREASPFQPTTDYDFQGVTLMAKNEEVDRFNYLRMSKLSGEKVNFESRREGKQRGEWKLIPEKLELKLGALVMILANRRELTEEDDVKLLYANGDLGTLVEVEGGYAQVKLQRNDQVVGVEYVCRKNKIPLEPGRRTELKAAGKEQMIDGKSEIVGSITYMPLRVAYACTAHKSQGLSLDSVQIDFRNSFFGSPGMLYVGISRARAAKGLRLVGMEATFVGRCKVSKEVKEWV